jgi:hypothetical protein
MSLFGWLTGGAKSADKVLSGMVKGIDVLVLTKEEKVQYTAKAQDVWLETQKVLSQESSPRSINRRIVAWAVIAETTLITITCMILIISGYKDLAEEIVKVATAFWWGEAFVSVIVFYFGNHIVTKLSNMGDK